MTEEYETGANHIIEVVHRILQRKKNPPVLFVQVDNCIRENKNRYFMCYFQSLVHLGVFKMVQISFLKIGHTHADIDQTFSSISSHLKINDAITLSELLQELRKCYARRVTASELSGVINYSGLCEKTNCLNEVESFSQYRYFRFLRKEGESTAGLCVSSCDVNVQEADSWIPFPNSDAQRFLKFVHGFRHTPGTVTKELHNETEVTKCLDEAEERVKDQSKMTLLHDLKRKVYHVRKHPFHWSDSGCFELNGDYAISSNSVVQMNLSSRIEEEMRPNYGYELDDFVAVAMDTDPSTGFWIGIVKCISQVDRNSHAKKLSLRWYVASGADLLG